MLRGEVQQVKYQDWPERPVYFKYSLPLISPTTGQYRIVTSPHPTMAPVPGPSLNTHSSLLPGFISFVNIAATHYPSPVRSQPEPPCWTVVFAFCFFLSWEKVMDISQT